MIATPSATTAALRTAITAGDLRGMVPFEPAKAPDANFDWSELSDDEIFALPPQLVCHVNRTAARDGLQVISPRQVPVNAMLKRVKPDRDYPLMFIAGSDAERSETWPIMPGAPPVNPADLVGAVRVKSGEQLADRVASRAATLQVRTVDQEDSLAGCILRAKACVDFQSRPDIGGDPDGLAESFDAVWGTDPGSFSEHLGETAAIDVALNRYAIGMDVSLPRSLAPIQDRRVTAVRATSGARDAFGPSRSVDWSRARVAAEVAVQMSADNEHASLADLSHAPTVLVGHKRANDPSVLAFQVHAAASWGCDPGSFSVLTDGSVPPVIGTVPKGLADYAMNDMEVIRPSLIARHLRVPVQWTKRFADRKSVV